MKLKEKGNIEIFDAIVTGEIASLENNEPLAMMLDKINSDGIQTFLQDDQVSNFAKGLINSFREEGLLSGDMVTTSSMEIIETKKSWKRLNGQFRITVAFKDRLFYLVDCVPNYEGDTSGFSVKTIPIEYVGEYSNNFGKCIKKIKFDPNWYISKPITVEMASCYDYIKNKNVYELTYNDKKYSFDENEYTFKLYDSYNAKERLESAINLYSGLSVSGVNVSINEYDTSNPLIKGVIASVFEKGFFNHTADNYEIEEIRLNVSSEKLSKQLLLEYLLLQAESKYLGYSQITSIIAEFYSLFNQCAVVADSTRQLYSQLIDLARERSSVAYLRLLAYRDLLPDEISKTFELSTKDFSNSKKSMDEIVNKIIGSSGDIKAVKMATQYACKNIGISRNALLFAKSLKHFYNVPLTFITCADNDANENALMFYRRLKHDQSILFREVDKNEISRKIHDRYILVEKNDGCKDWYKMSGELDAIRYENDFINGEPNGKITESTVAYVKELTVYKVSEDGIIKDVKSLMENK